MNVLVIGSINIDDVHYLREFPLSGETIVEEENKIFHGGKGANQAIAINKLMKNKKNNVYLFSKIGNDSRGQLELDHLKKEGLKVDFIKKSSSKKTGKATILISYLEKNNKILINKGANEDFDEKDWSLLESAIKSSDIILFQLETNEWLIENALKICKEYKKEVILNPAPAENFKEEWLEYIDWLIPNETELEFIMNKKITNIDQIDNAIIDLKKKGLKNIIVTLGDSGIYIKTDDMEKWIEAEKIENVVDTTAAGDTFIGGFVAYCMLDTLSDKMSLSEKLKYAISAAGITVTKKGAQESIPDYEEVKKWRRQR